MATNLLLRKVSNCNILETRPHTDRLAFCTGLFHLNDSLKSSSHGEI